MKKDVFELKLTSHRCYRVARDLETAFDWSDTTDGTDYWIKVHDKLHAIANLYKAEAERLEKE